MQNIIQDLKRILDEQARIKSIQEKKLAGLRQYKELRLLASKKTADSNTYYYAKKKGIDKRTYLGARTDPDVIAICECRYFEESLDRIEGNIRAINDFTEAFREIDFESVRNELPKIYRLLDAPGAAPLAQTDEEWVNDMEQLKARYPITHPDELKIRTSDGKMVRSKSEALIANIYNQYGIPYVYELPHFIDSEVIRADFTLPARTASQGIIIHEHIGLLGNPDYEKTFLWKLKKYLHAKYVPNENLFFTFDDPDGGFDIMQVQNIIDRFLIK